MPATSDPMPHRHPLRTPADVRRVLATEIERVAANSDLDPLRRAQSLAQLTRVVLRAMELETLAARVEAIESTLRFQKEALAQEEKQWGVLSQRQVEEVERRLAGD